jgi:regulator of cell morphogenesis and NO signaling
MNYDFDQAIEEIVKADYRTAEVFKRYRINYCCGGRVSLQSICSEKKIDRELLKDDLDRATNNIYISNSLPYDEWELDFLIGYIIHIHHHFIYREVSFLGSELRSFAASHNKKYPEFSLVSELFDELFAILTIHNHHEDEIIFPYMKQIDSAYRRKEAYGNLFVRTLRKPLSIVEKEHIQIRELLDKLQSITNHFSFPVNACTNYQVLYHKLKEFKDNLVQHKFLEDKILFPKAIAIEQQLLQL